MAAFRRAVELGAAFIETDLHISRDARLVCVHDATLERTTNATGAVKELTLAQLRELDAGSWFGPEFAGERIPTLEEILAFAREQDIVIFLEVKQEAAWGIEHGLVAALRGAQEAARAVMLSFSPGVLRNIRRLDNTLMTGLLFEAMPNGGPAAIVERALEIGARQLAPRGDIVTPELLECAHRSDLQVVCWTINQPEQMRQLIDAGVDGIMTDYPDRLVAALNESK
ncbi:MAG: glycerophosphodiester phosphodiesterase [Acidobacteria bacterium]|nr:glycerophosphodiester phosphodiesterase [Acidobacteriota bacterium]MCL5286782.1 glycerophosphodiester phosphodiesterase [Acidobacteriota bacterium]